ncbi:MAG: hypothetical protein AAB601_02685, partial [Patescibacteria group bacterium]
MQKSPEKARESEKTVLPLNADSIRNIDAAFNSVADEERREVIARAAASGKTMLFQYADYYLAKLTDSLSEKTPLAELDTPVGEAAGTPETVVDSHK